LGTGSGCEKGYVVRVVSYTLIIEGVCASVKNGETNINAKRKLFLEHLNCMYLIFYLSDIKSVIAIIAANYPERYHNHPFLRP
jgi:hypothetical protein